jgi:mRNA interferase MazF
VEACSRLAGVTLDRARRTVQSSPQAGSASLIVCQMTSDGDDAPDFRVVVEPTPRNGLHTRFHVMADKPVTIRRARIGKKIGHLDDSDIARLKIALAFVMGLAD